MKKLFILLVAVTGIASCQNADQQSGPKLSNEAKEKAVKDTANFTTIEWIDAKVLDLGKRAQNQDIDVAFRFRNSGKKNLIIANVHAGCGCTIPEQPGKPYLPGEEGVIKAKFHSGAMSGAVMKQILVSANTIPSPDTLKFTADISDNN